MKNILTFSITLLILIFAFAENICAATPAQLLQQADSAVNSAQYKKAINLYKQVLAQQPSNAKAYNNLGFAYAQSGQLKNAIDSYTAALNIKSDYSEAKNNLIASTSQYAQQSIDKGQYSQAVETLRKTIGKYPQAGELYYFLGVAYQAQNKPQEAFNNWKKAADLNPKSSIAQYVKAIEKLMKKDLTGAQADLKKAIAVMPKNAYARNMLGIIQVQNGQLEEAKQTFSESVKIKPNYIEPYLNLAYLSEKEGDNTAAVNYYKTAATKNPYSVKALMAMGKIYFLQGKFFDAEASYKRAARVTPLSPDIHKSLAFTYAKQNKYPQAIKEFQTAVGISPDDPEANYALGLIYKSVNTPEYLAKAEESFRKAAASVNSQYSAMAQQKLSEMGSAQNAASSSVMPAHSQEPANITAESPDGDLSITVNTDWTEIPGDSSGDDRVMWMMSNINKGLMLIVYKPQSVEGESSSLKQTALSIAGSGLSSASDKPAAIGNTQGIMLEGKDRGGKIRRIYAAQTGNKIYIISAESPQSEFFSEINSIISQAIIK